MTRTELSDERLLRDAGMLADEVWVAVRNRGHRRADVERIAAETLGITPRRLKALIYQEAATVVTPDEYAAISARYLVHLEQEAERHTTLADSLRKRVQSMRETHALAVARIHKVARRSPARPSRVLGTPGAACA